MNILTYKGSEIVVVFNEDTHYFQEDENGILTRYIVNTPYTPDTTKQITLNWTRQSINNLGEIKSANKGDLLIADNGVTYKKWYNYPFSGIGGVFNFGPAFNGVISAVKKDNNLYCQNPLQNFVFFQPVIFTVDATQTTATANVSDGQVQKSINIVDGEEVITDIPKTLEYTLDSPELEIRNWQSSNIFEGLNSDTEYTFYARTTQDLWESKISFRTLVNT